MPKIVPNLEQRILDVATLSFEKHGYKKVDMRTLATVAGVSVGSVYSRFKSKGELFLRVADRWRDQMLVEIQENMLRLSNDRNRLYVLTEVLLTNIQKRGGIWREFFSDPDSRSDSEGVQRAMRDMEKLWKKFSDQVENLIINASQSEKIKDLAHKYKGRLSAVFRGLITGLALGYPSQPKKNIEFARAFLEVIL